MSNSISIIIPYFQRDPTLLGRSVLSIFLQTIDAELNVIIVDDDSPYPARKAMENISPPDRISLRIIEQTNRGAAFARNKGLEAVPVECEFIAFLDSDDYWCPNHLEVALKGLSSGLDFYFCDGMAEGEAGDLFSKFNVLNDLGCSKPAFDQFFKIDSGKFQEAIIKGYVTTPTVVFRRSAFGNIFFPTEFSRCGEDQFLWLQMSNLSQSVLFSLNVGAIYGKGVNIYSEQIFGTVKDSLRIRDEILFRKKFLAQFKSYADSRALMKSRLRHARESFCWNALHRLRRGDIKPLLFIFRSDPVSYFYLTKAIVGKLLKGLWSKP